MKLKRLSLWILVGIILILILGVGIQFQAHAQTSFLSIFSAPHNASEPLQSQLPTSENSASLSATQAYTSTSASPVMLISGTNSNNRNTSLNSLAFPIRAAFYYPWFPEGWNQLGIDPYSQYAPTLGYYDLSDKSIIRQQLEAMMYGHIQAGIASWWGPGSPTDGRIASLLSAAEGTNFKWAIYYEAEGIGNPDVRTMSSDLLYLRDHYSNDPAFLRINGRFVVFVYADASDGCAMVDRWKQANTVNAYIVLKIFPGYQRCSNQPDGWHQYAPAKAEISVGQYSFTISPGYWKVGEKPQLARNLQEWQKNIQDMVASGANFQLITTFNEWGEGTAVESANQWSTTSGYGAYLDTLHDASISYKRYMPTIANQISHDPVIIGAGDIAACDSPGDEETALLLRNFPGPVFTLGDNAYESGTLSEFTKCYQPSWGLFKSYTYPSVGNHDYLTVGATGYFDYFGAAAGDPNKGYYSYDISNWHIIVLNSNCSEVGGCDLKSPQIQWLQADLASHPNLCTLAYWHHPRFSSGEHGNNTRVDPFWQVLYPAGVDLILNGHDHDYERFAPQNPEGLADPLQGMREIVVGTGGKNLTSISSPITNSEVHNDNTWGVLEVTLHSTSYDWKFIPVAGSTFTDSGSAACH